MDDEDKAEAAESRDLETAQSVATIGRVGDNPTDTLFGLFVTEEETMGVRIAQKMGWRRDQGVGRKVRRTARLGGSREDDSSNSGHLFAPQDSRMISAVSEMVNRKGLGYQSEARLGTTQDKEPEDRPMLALPFLEGSSRSKGLKKPAPKKSSFGVGVLNDTGSDDEDPYELGPKITFNKTIGKAKKAKKPSKFAQSGTGDQHVFKSKKTSGQSSGISRQSYDGKPPLSGFMLVIEPVNLARKKKHPPAKIPAGWKSSKSVAQPEETQNYQSVSDAAKSSTLDARARASLLGESMLPGKSVFDFIPKDVRDRLASMTGKSNLPQGRGEGAPEGYQDPKSSKAKDLWTFVPVLDKGTAAAALAKGATGWMPYAEDLKKRARYVGFLELRAGMKNSLPERAENMSVSEWAKELQEFAHAAEVFKPTTGIMASRFTSSTSSSLPGTADNTGESHLRQKASKPEDPAEQAAKLGMYGPMTRSSFPFYPSRLLCKRFNVKPPPDMPHDADADSDKYGFRSKTQEAVNKSAMDKLLHEVLTKGGPALHRPAWMGIPSQEPASATQSSAAVPLSDAGHAVVDVEKNDALDKERPSDDVFKSIFGDDDDDQ